MFSFVQNWFAQAPYPVGIDYGTDCLRMAQVDRIDQEFRLIAAASAEVPSQVRDDAAERLTFFTETLREQWRKGNFRGRRAVLSIPARHLHLQHVRVPPTSADHLNEAILKQARENFPFDLSDVLLRPIVAGDVYQDQEPRTEVLLMGARRQFVDDLLASAARGRIDVVGLSVEPRALIDCFLNIYRRKSDLDVTSCFIDIGSSGSRVTIARGKKLLFARKIPIGGEHFNRAVATEFNITLPQAEALRLKLAAEADEATSDKRNVSSSAGLPDHADAPSSDLHSVADQSTSDPQRRIELAIRERLSNVVEELALCRRYHETAFPQHPIQRLIFVGGEAGHRRLCKAIAQGISLPAHIGDPLVRMGRTTDVGIESGIDRRRPQPAWAVAIGLSMGPASDAINAPENRQKFQRPSRSRPTRSSLSAAASISRSTLSNLREREPS